jgi:hypothetical protein
MQVRANVIKYKMHSLIIGSIENKFLNIMHDMQLFCGLHINSANLGVLAHDYVSFELAYG